ncbi:uncharacterized protein LOC131843110 [Achroia grisella]|uniref:uncharacterized protein LOC131843110 n=1 Tax=Achroia grisella TaxID=688607 RepID=UPI0027D2680D|nr:uncharacterized protein LOC131843110 [Achroia grisella]
MLNLLIFSTILGRSMVQNYDEYHVHSNVSPSERLLQYQTRCTRRFTPGVCIEHVVPVWTYEFHIQNCTERLGCPYATRTNRFMSYRQCINRCRSLIDMYSHILSVDNEQYNSSDMGYLRNHFGRREGIDVAELIELPEVQDNMRDNEAPDYDSRDDVLIYNPAVTVEDEDIIALNEVIPQDIDKVDDMYLNDDIIKHKI